MPTEDRQMYSAISDITRFNQLVSCLEAVEALRAKTVTQARKNIAPRLGVSICTLENYRTLRLKGVPHWLMQTVQDVLIDTLRKEMEKLGHEVEIARQSHGGHRDDALVEAETHLAKVRSLLVGKTALRVATHFHKADPPR